jgi:putative endonuclease
MAYFTYILKSQKDGRYYFGHTNDIEKRLNEHNRGKVKSTKGRTPFVLYYCEQFETKSLAFQREMFFKSLDGRNWLKSNSII